MSPLNQLKLLRKIEPDQSWLILSWQRVEKAAMLPRTQAIGSRVLSNHILDGAAWLLFPKFAPPLAIVVLLISTTLIVNASSRSIPGDSLYPLKLAIEKTRLALTPYPDKPVIHTEFADERLSELRKITARSVSEKSEKTRVAVESFKKEVTSTHKELIKLEKKNVTQDSRPDKNKKIAQSAKNIQEKTKAFGEALTKVSEELSPETKQEVAQEVKEALVAIADTNVTSLKVLVEESAKEVITESEVKALVDQAIQEEEKSLKAVSQFLSSPRDTLKKLKEARELLSKKDLRGAILKIAEIHESVKEASAKKDELEKEIIIFTPKKGIQEVTP